MILSLPLCVRPSALFHIRINFEKHRCLRGFLEQEDDGPSRGLYVRWARGEQEKANTFAQIVTRTRNRSVWAVLSLTPRGNVVNVSYRPGVLVTTDSAWKLCVLPTNAYTCCARFLHLHLFFPIGRLFFLMDTQCIICEIWVMYLNFIFTSIEYYLDVPISL